MANGNDSGLTTQFLVGACTNFAHRHQQAALDSSLLKFPGFANIEQNTTFSAARSQQFP